jgi:DNA-binding CsgD family transcriptional regulator
MDLLHDTLDEQLRRRLALATAEARRLLGREARSEASDERVDLQSLIESLSGRRPARADAEAAAEHAAALDRLTQRFEGRFEAIRRVQAAVAELRGMTSPGSMLARAPAALCEASTLRRAVLSIVSEAKMTAEAVHFEGDPDGARETLAELRLSPVSLEHPLIETELVRRRRATIVVDAHMHPRVDRRTAELMAWRSYVAAPLAVGTRLIGVIHADRGPEHPLGVLDRDVLWEFAIGLAQAYERAGLRRALRREREDTRRFLEWIGARSGELTDARITLADAWRPPLPPPQPVEDPTPTQGRDDRLVFAGLLTRRELDVLRLLAEGNSNKAAADALVVSAATVKFHVNGILRKLHAANRAEAVSRYLALLGMPPP